MPDEFTPQELAVDRLRRFRMCQNFPANDDVCIGALAEGLVKAAERFKVTMDAIVTRWAESSKFCPTEYDLLETAEEIWAERVRSTPPPRIGCQACDYTGWKHSEDGGQGTVRICECRKKAS